MFALNTVALIGRLGKDPELRHTPSGMAVCGLRIAVDGAGEKVGDEYKPGWFDVTVWGDQGENCARYLVKGQQVGVVGQLKFREWEAREGGKRTAVEVNARSVQFLAKAGEGGGDGTFEPVQQQPAAQTNQPATADPFAGGGSSDDGIPF